MHDEHVGHLLSVGLASLLIGGKQVAACLHAHFPKCRQRRVPAAWSGDLCEEPVTFRGSPKDFREGVEAFGAKRKPRFRGNDAWRGDSRSLRGVAANGGPRGRIHLPPAESLRTLGPSAQPEGDVRGIGFQTVRTYIAISNSEARRAMLARTIVGVAENSQAYRGPRARHPPRIEAF